jgi:[acyl-carrier-protein] S-malonyltransferase
MGQALAAAHREAGLVFEQAFAALGPAFRRVLWEGPEEELRQTRHAQPALLVHSVAALRVLEARGVRASLAAGHSLGEYTAHVAAGSLRFADALRLVRRRGELMQEAGRQRPGTMAAVLGLDAEAVGGVCRATREAGEGIVVPANLNSPSQVVISGEVGAVEAALRRATEAGARKVIRLTVSGAFHSPLMEPAAGGLKAALTAVEIRDAAFPVIANATARPVVVAEEIREALGMQLLAPVRWAESVRALLDAGARVFVEIGSGSVLRGLVRSIDRRAVLAGLSVPEDLPETLAALSQAGLEVQV